MAMATVFAFAGNSVLMPKGDKTTLQLCGNGSTPYTIIYEAGSVNAKSAAQELRAYLRILFKGTLPALASEDEMKAEQSGPFISVGMTRMAKEHGIGAKFPQDRASYEIRLDGANLFLAGSRTNFDAVMAFLEEDAGCRFFTPEIKVLPEADPFVVGVTPRMKTADFTRRLILTEVALVYPGSVWWRNNRVMMWDHFDHPHDWFCHTYGKIVPMTDFGRTPELFAVVNGKPSNTMICPTHPENIRRAIELVRKAMDANPNKSFFSIAENDGGYPYCQCDRCMAIIKAHGGAPIAAHLTLVNAVAKAVQDKAPRQFVDFIVYSRDFRKCPTDFSLEPNVMMWFCTNDLPSTASRIDHTDKVDDFNEWRKLAKKTAIWEYGVDFSDYFHVVSTFPAKVNNLRFYSQNGVEGVMMHEVLGVRGGDLQRLRAWVFAKLLWDTSLDEDELAREYCLNVYGEGAESMFEYYRLVNEPCRKGGQTIEQYYGIGTFLKRADALFKTAIEKAKGNSKALKEIETDYLPILVSRINSIYNAFPENKNDFPLAEYRGILEITKRIVREYKIGNISEIRSMAGYLQEREMLLQVMDGGNGAFEVRAVNGRLYNYPQVKDPLAEGCSATRQACDANWIVQWVMPTNLMEKGRLYQLSAEMRVEKASVSETPCGAGIYDVKEKRLLFFAHAKPQELSVDKYNFIELGQPFSISHDGEIYVFFSAPVNSDVGHFFVNRIRVTPVEKK